MGLTRIIAVRLAKFVERFITKPYKDPLATQVKFFHQLIRRNEQTLFGKRHNFSRIHSIKHFQKNCPISTYKDYEPYIKLMIEDYKQPILTTSHLLYWGQTTGTTGTPKIVPIPYHMFTDANMSIFLITISYLAEDPPNHSRFLDGKTLFLAAYPILRYEGKLPVGYGTGIFSHFKGGTQRWKHIMKNRLYIPIHLYRIKNIEQRNYQLTKEVINQDFRQISGVPSIVTNTLENILENASKFGVNAKKIRDIFPDYHFSFFAGVSPKFYEKRLFNLIGHKIDYREQFSSTEGVIGVQLQKEPGFTPMVEANFFEFLSVKNPEERCLINEIKKNEEYFVIVSGYNGFYAYNIGDIVKFVSEDPPLFVFSSRKGVVNLVDEKVSHDDVLYTFERTNQQFDTVLTDFSVVALRKPDFHYLFIVEFSPKHHPTSYKDYLRALDTFLMEGNDVYRYFRQDTGLLKEPILWVLQTGAFAELLKEKVAAGAPREQSKVQHLTDNPKVKKELEDKVESEIKI